ncbi:hypothetical protein L218DRAFT_968306 [Marasmius fiardii PR-910]|nr:hypothetical protein L218DRAFT_968306 [Marasmius fiardii PR-910]
MSPSIQTTGASSESSRNPQIHLPPIQDTSTTPTHRLPREQASSDNAHLYLPSSRINNLSTCGLDKEVDTLPELSPDATDQQRVDYQLSLNRIAARRNRQLEEEYVAQLQNSVEQLATEKEKWNATARVLQNAEERNQQHDARPVRVFSKRLEETTAAGKKETVLDAIIRKEEEEEESSSEEELEPLSPHATDQQRVTRQRFSNMYASRRYRQRRTLYVEQLEESIQQLTGEVEEWKTCTEALSKVS